MNLLMFEHLKTSRPVSISTQSAGGCSTWIDGGA